MPADKAGAGYPTEEDGVTPHGELVPKCLISRERINKMKQLLLYTGILSLLTTTGCLVSEDRRGHARYEHHDAVVVRGPVVVEPEVVVRPPLVIVR